MLPTRVRIAVMLTLVVSMLVSFGASQGAALAFSAPELTMPEVDLDGFSAWSPDPEVMKEALKAGFRAELASVNGMRTARLVILIALSVASGLVLVSALRMRWAFGMSRSQLAQLLSKAALATTVIRTMDGAQTFATELRVTAARAEVMMTSTALNLGGTVDAVTFVFRAVNLATTFGVVFCFFVMWRYFGSTRLHEELERLDAENERQPPQP